MDEHKRLPEFPPDDPLGTIKYLRERAEGHAPGYDITIYARPSTWRGLADLLEGARGRAVQVEERYDELRKAVIAVAKTC